MVDTIVRLQPVAGVPHNRPALKPVSAYLILAPYILSDSLNFILNVYGQQSLDSKRPTSFFPSIDANNSDTLAHPTRRQVDAAGVSRLFDFLFDQLFPEEREFALGEFAKIVGSPANLFKVRFIFGAAIAFATWRNMLVSFQLAPFGIPDW